MKMLDPAVSKTPGVDERQEVFRSSVKAMGLGKDALTPDHKIFVQRRYDTMVLQKGSHASNQ